MAQLKDTTVHGNLTVENGIQALHLYSQSNVISESSIQSGSHIYANGKSGDDYIGYLKTATIVANNPTITTS